MMDVDLEALLRTRADAELPELAIFGPVSSCRSLEEVIGLLRDVRYYERSNAAAYGMALCSALHPKGQYRDDVLQMLDRLSLAKALIDHRICHTFPVVAVTAEVLLAAQKFADEATIPCTEWPSVEDVQAAVLKAASVYAKVERPRRPKLLSAYLAERLRECDAGRVIGVDGRSQSNMRARVEAVYSTRHGLSDRDLGRTIQFLGQPTTWGNLALRDGERAVIFLRSHDGGLGEYPSNGHCVIEEMNGEDFVVFRLGDAYFTDVEPADAAEQPQTGWPAVRLSVVEARLLQLRSADGA